MFIVLRAEEPRSLALRALFDIPTERMPAIGARL
jgi:hypothetical protein